MIKNALITQCLQVDFVAPIGKYDEIPNLLHIGFDESHRLMGEDPSVGPIGCLMQWANKQAPSELKQIHIRDWHDQNATEQKEHLQRFGRHCIAGSPGAELVFELPRDPKDYTIINSLSLNDFIGTDLNSALADLDPQGHFGIAGVWTEAKVAFLAYELATRFPHATVGVCSALTASSSRSSHHMALDRLEAILGIRIMSSVGEFIEFLGGTSQEIALPKTSPASHGLKTNAADFSLATDDLSILNYLFRDCLSVSFKVLDGGFSGNLVLGTESIDQEKRQQVPHVVKIGERSAIGAERAAFEKIESVLGNVAPRIVEFVDYKGRGAIKYRYASMGGTFSSTFQKKFMAGMSQESVDAILHIVFGEQLNRLYCSVERENVNLMNYYCFSSEWTASVEKRVHELATKTADGRWQLAEGIFASDIVGFYRDCDSNKHLWQRSSYFGYVHGDLNGANIIIDDRNNVWIIDFFHTHRGHILKDLIKLENDLLYIFTPISNTEELAQATRLTDLLIGMNDLWDLPPDYQAYGITEPQLIRAWRTIKTLRSFYRQLIQSDRDPGQYLIGALRYAVHTLGFDEPDTLQKKWALYAAGSCVGAMNRVSTGSDILRLDWLCPHEPNLSITILPGRRDYHRNLADDIQTLAKNKVAMVVCLATRDELDQYGVSNLESAYQKSKIATLFSPMIDQKACPIDQINEILAAVHKTIRAGSRVLIHCVGGLGRSGMIAACHLVTLGLAPQDAIAAVRRARSERAIETKPQEVMVEQFARTLRKSA